MVDGTTYIFFTAYLTAQRLNEYIYIYIYIYILRDEENTSKKQQAIKSLAKKEEAYLVHQARER